MLLVLGALWTGADGDWRLEFDRGDAIVWLFVAGLGLATAGALTDFLFPASLAFGPQGVSWGRFRRRRLAWSEVGEFKVVHGRIGFDYAEAYRPAEREGREFDRNLRGMEADLPRGLKVDPLELVGELNQARRRWAA